MISLCLVPCAVNWSFVPFGEFCRCFFVFSCDEESSDSIPDWSSDLVRLCAPYLPFGGLLMYGVSCLGHTLCHSGGEIGPSALSSVFFHVPPGAFVSSTKSSSPSVMHVLYYASSCLLS